MIVYYSIPDFAENVEFELCSLEIRSRKKIQIGYPRYRSPRAYKANVEEIGCDKVIRSTVEFFYVVQVPPRIQNVYKYTQYI